MSVESELITIGRTSPIRDYANRTRPAATSITSLTNILNGRFDSDADGNGKTIFELGGLQVGYNTTKEICIGIRTSGKAGCGSWDDPFDGSTRQKYDALLATYGTIPNTIIRHRDGEYQTYGAYALDYAAGVRLVGNGIANTTIKQVYLPTNNVNFGVLNCLGDNFEVHDLTVDCNYAALYAALGGTRTNTNIFAIFARSGVIHNVRAIHAGGDMETFVIALQAYGPVGGDAATRFASAPTRSHITGCIVELPDPTNHALTCFAVNAGYYESANIPNEDVTPYGQSALIADCIVTGPNLHTNIAFQMGGFRSGTIRNAYSMGSRYGFFHDTFPNNGLNIDRFAFLNCATGILFNGGGTNAVNGGKISRGRIETTDSGIGLNDAYNMVVDDVDILVAEGGFVGAGAQNIIGNEGNGGLGGTNNTYRNIRVDPLFENADLSFGSPKLSGIRYMDGSTVPGLEDNFIPQLHLAIITQRANASTLGSNQTIADHGAANLKMSVVEAMNDLIDVSDTTAPKIVAPGPGTISGVAKVTFASATSGGYVDISAYLGAQIIDTRRIASPVANNSYPLPFELEVVEGSEITILVTNESGGTLTIDKTHYLTGLSASFYPMNPTAGLA